MSTHALTLLSLFISALHFLEECYTPHLLTELRQTLQIGFPPTLLLLEHKLCL